MRVDARDVRRLIPKLDYWLDVIQDWRPVFEAYHPDFLAMMRAQFVSQGGLTGGWLPLSPAYAARKARERPGRRIMVYDGTLEASLSDKGAAGQIKRIGPRTAMFGTDVPYAHVHHKGYPAKRIPIRQLIPDRDEVLPELAARAKQYLDKVIR